MESIVNYESDDGNLKNTNKSAPRKISVRHEEKRHCSSDDDSSDSSSSPRERKRKVLTEDSSRTSPSPRQSSGKSSRYDNHKSHESRSDKHRAESSSKDADRYERKRKNDERKRYRDHSRDREKRRERSDSREREEISNRDRYRDRSSERHKERYDAHRKHGRRDGERSIHRNISRNPSDFRSNSSSSNCSSAIRRAEALNRTIERRANEKVQQLQKLGIEIPTLIQQQQQLKLQSQQAIQIKPLMSVSTSISSGGSKINSATPSTGETTTENDNNLTLNMSNFTSSVLTNARYTEQMQKKKLIWGTKKTINEPTTTNNKWEVAKFSQDTDGKVASKFLRLMGMKNAPVAASTSGETLDSSVAKREQMFSSMEQQYEIARQVTHTMRGVGLGFGSQSRP